tara:strand:+ start:664 stop:1158 length:495 start_codon:yes stop_codon:yes gene_type:complete
MQNRKYWLAPLSLFTLILLSALFFQHVKGMEPCYLCIIQRLGVIISIIGSLIGIIKPSIQPLNLTGTLTVFSGLFVSLVASVKLVYLQANPPIFSSCGMDATNLMENYGFLKSLPMLFEGSASCTTSSGGFLFFTFEQWTLFLFSTTLIGLTSLLFFTKRRKNV